MEHMKPVDLFHILARTPKDLRNLLQANPSLVLAGGAIRSLLANEKVNDFDVFGPSKAVAHAAAKDLALNRQARIYETDNAYTVLSAGRPPVQFIHRWAYSVPQAVLEDFDFTIAQAGVFFADDEWQGLVGKSFYSDLAAKRLIYLAPQREEEPGGSILRMRKFLARGYFIPIESLSKLVTRFVLGVNEIRSTVSEDYLNRTLKALLREVDPLVQIDGLEAAETEEAA